MIERRMFLRCLMLWENVKVETDEDLRFLGVSNLRALRRDWMDELAKADFAYRSIMTRADLTEDLSNCLEAKLTDVVYVKNRISEYLETIDVAMEDAEEKPCFNRHRSVDWLQNGDRVVCYVDSNKAILRNVFVSGTVTDCEARRAGYAVVCTDKKVHSLDYYDGRGLSYVFRSPKIMFLWEYEYLKAYEEYLDIWLRAGDARAGGFSPYEMLGAFRRR